MNNNYPLTEEHICFDKGHNMFLVVEN